MSEPRLELAQMFGEPVKQLVKHKEFSLPGMPEIGILSSDHRDAVTGKRVYQGGSWHSDHSHISMPPRGPMLYTLQIPGKGGDTRFTNQRAAYKALSAERIHALEGLKAMHVYESKYTSTKANTRRAKCPPAPRPLRACRIGVKSDLTLHQRQQMALVHTRQIERNQGKRDSAKQVHGSIVSKCDNGGHRRSPQCRVLTTEHTMPGFH